MEELLDHELMERIKGGEQQAFTLLIQRHQSPLLNYFRRLGANNDAEDLVQDVFLRVYRYRDRYVHKAKFTTFLYTVAWHVWADRWRKRQRAEKIEERAKQEMPAESEANLEHVQNTLDAQQALTLLPDKLRIVLIMSIYQGMRYNEIADILQIPAGTVKSRVFLAMNRLKEIYHDQL
jgi:RNA polymerase sigma-70 factor (ECF subfamily)